jgi:hypothetical protein
VRHAARVACAALRVVVALAILVSSRPARADGDPDLDWWTIETAHFRVTYPRSVEPVAARVAALAETVHGRLRDALGYSPKNLTEIVLTDDSDSANGSATALPFNTIRLFVTAPEDLSPLGDYDDWYLDLVTHEYTHILHTDNISGVPAIVNAIIGKTLAPNQVQPRWLLEGLAVVNESRYSSAGRMRSALFDMYLRADVLADNVAGLDQMSSNALRWPQGNLWYLYGSRFLGWITDVYGPNTMRAVSADYGATVAPWGINRAIRRVTGRTYEELFDGWKDHIRRRYADQVKTIEQRGLREGRRLTYHGRNVFSPRFVPPVARRRKGVEELVFFRDDFDDRPGVYRAALPAAARAFGGDAGPRSAPREELVARAAGGVSPCFTPSGGLVFTSASWWRNVYLRNDLFALPPKETAPGGEEPWRRRLTAGLRVQGPDVSPDGRRVVFTVNGKGTSYLEIADLEAEGTLARRHDLVPSARFEQAYTPRFSPDGRLVAYSAWTAGGFRDIRVVEVATGAFREVTHDRALDLEPAWSPDGKTLYFVSDRSGIYNVYAFDLATAALRQVTNVRVGAFSPDVSPDGKTLAYVGYTTEGYDLYVMPLEPERFLSAPPPPTDRPDPPTEPSDVPLRRTRYNPLLTVAPRAFSFAYKPGYFGGNALTLSARGADVVGHHAVGGSVTVDSAAPEPAFGFDYTYGRLPVDLTLRFSHSLGPRSGYQANGQRLDYVEYQNGLTSGVSYTLNNDFSQHAFGLSYTASSFRADLPSVGTLDPYAAVYGKPPAGIMGIVHAGYSYSNVEGNFDAAGYPRGVALGIGVDFADTATGSTYTLRAFSASLTGYAEMPWPGHHTLAARTSGAVAAGSYPERSPYYVGGYDLQNHGLVDTVTSGIYNGAFVLRGYPAGAYAGSEYLLQTFEYRVPVVQPDHGLSTLPVYLRRIDANLFLDWGGAFNKLRVDQFALFDQGALLNSRQFHTAVGGELWIGTTLGYALPTQFRLGYARGFSVEAIPGGQWYFIAAGAF